MWHPFMITLDSENVTNWQKTFRVKRSGSRNIDEGQYLNACFHCKHISVLLYGTAVRDVLMLSCLLRYQLFGHFYEHNTLWDQLKYLLSSKRPSYHLGVPSLYLDLSCLFSRVFSIFAFPVVSVGNLPSSDKVAETALELRNVSLVTHTAWYGQWRIQNFPDVCVGGGGVLTPKVGVKTYYYGIFFLKNAWKWKKNGRGTHPWPTSHFASANGLVPSPTPPPPKILTTLSCSVCVFRESQELDLLVYNCVIVVSFIFSTRNSSYIKDEERTRYPAFYMFLCGRKTLWLFV